MQISTHADQYLYKVYGNQSQVDCVCVCVGDFIILPRYDKKLSLMSIGSRRREFQSRKAIIGKIFH